MALRSRFPRIQVELEAVVEAAVKRGAEHVAARARDRAPVGEPTVHLRDAIHVERDAAGYSVVAGDTEVFYGHMVEHGTSHSAPRPFLVPALMESEGEILALLKLALRDL